MRWGLVPTPVSKTGCPERGRVRFLRLPRLESKLKAGAESRLLNDVPRKRSGSSPLLSAEETMSSSADSVIVEVRAAEGGNDAKLLVLEQVKIYLRLCTRRSL